MKGSAKKQAKQLAKLLAADPTSLSAKQNLRLLDGLHGVISQVSARRERVLAELADPGHGSMWAPRDEKEWVREEIGAMLHWSYPYTQSRLAQARSLVHDLPATLELHEAGAIGPEHARAVVDATAGLDPSVRAKVEARVLDRAPSQTSTELKRSLTRAVNSIDPRGAEEKHQAAKSDRGVWLRPLPNGMCGLWSLHDAVTAEAIMTRLNARADARIPGDERTLDQRRADALADLILGCPTHPSDRDGAPCGPEVKTRHGRRPMVNIIVALDVALGLSDLPGELIGYGPIPASLCREALADPSATLRRLVVNPLGQLVDCSTIYEPSQALTDRIILRDRVCTFPGCHRAACRCELDHVTPFDGTNTVEKNLHPLCCRHHHAKHDANWRVKRQPDGVTDWTSPAGRHYTKPPEPYPTNTLLDRPPETPEPDEDPPPF